VRSRPRRSARDAVLAAWLVGWLGWQAAAGAARVGAAVVAAEPAELVRALARPLDERVRVALNPFGQRLLELLRTRTPSDATVHLVTDASPAMHRLWLGLCALAFPRVIVPRGLDRGLAAGVTSFVIVPAGSPPPAADAELLDAGRGGPDVWLVEPGAR
jgi:hypothetical protein